MGTVMKTDIIHISGMTCVNCENVIQKKLRKTAGISKAEVSYRTGTARVEYDSDLITLQDIHGLLRKLGYEAEKPAKTMAGAARAVGLLIIIAALYMVLEQFGLLNLLAPGQLAEADMGYGMIFVIGLITSVHCVAMCGGINLSQCIPCGTAEGADKQSAFGPALWYNAGRVISYTVVGFIVGALGSVITFSNTAQGILKLAAGVFMVIMGINMLNIFPWLRKLNPRIPGKLAAKINRGKDRSSSPLIVGLLNGLMPCGPLQAMQIYALSTGNPFAGALSMFLFSAGTVPLMFGIGALSSLLSKKFSRRMISAGAVLVAVLGLSMLTQGMTLSGFGSIAAVSETAGTEAGSADGAVADGVQVINSTLMPRTYPAITVRAGIPVKWVIDAPRGSINGCNYSIYISEYGLEHQFSEGENIIEFTPEQTGTFDYSCWMGMIRGKITVVDSDEDTDTAIGDTTSLALEPTPADYQISADELTAAEIKSEDGKEYQTVTINITESGYSPAAVVLQSGVETKLIVNDTTGQDVNKSLLIPTYYTKLDLLAGENPISLLPEQSFAMSNGDYSAFAYVKVVEDLGAIDREAIKEEVETYQPMVYPPDYFPQGGSCCQ